MTDPDERDPAAAEADSRRRDHIAEDSDDLVSAIESMHRLEAEKRQEPMSSPRFHERANQIERLARRVFALARSQREVGELLSGQQERSIDDEAAAQRDR
jgi:hypothetical protein